MMFNFNSAFLIFLLLFGIDSIGFALTVCFALLPLIFLNLQGFRNDDRWPCCQKLQAGGRAIKQIDSGHWHCAPKAHLSTLILGGMTVLAVTKSDRALCDFSHVILVY